jgi:hypothetical protein
MKSQPLHTSLAISGRHRDRLRRHLYPDDGKEAIAIALCGLAKGRHGIQLLVHDVVEVPYSACRIRTPETVAWSVESVLPTLNRAMRSRFTVVKFHSHPGGHAEFSHYDDRSDVTFFTAVDNVLDTLEMRGSVVMLPDGRMFGRTILDGILGAKIDVVRVAGDDFEFYRNQKNEDHAELPDHAIRLAQAFGEGTYRALTQLRVGVVGCSGTGSIIVEQLARNCVGEIVVVDPDHLERKNLNRILNARGIDADKRRSKVSIAKEAIVSMDLGTAIYGLEQDIFCRDVVLALSECDILFGCVDSVDGRHILNKIASHFLIPLIDLGVRIDADGKGNVDHVFGAVHTVLPGGSSLMSRGVYSQADLDAAFMKRSEPERYKDMVKQGYVKGQDVERPAVISLNMMVASVAVNEMLARLVPYRAEPNSAFAQRRLNLTDPLASRDDNDGEVCSTFAKRVGLGSLEPLLGMPEL